MPQWHNMFQGALQGLACAFPQCVQNEICCVVPQPDAPEELIFNVETPADARHLDTLQTREEFVSWLTTCGMGHKRYTDGHPVIGICPSAAGCRCYPKDEQEQSIQQDSALSMEVTMPVSEPLQKKDEICKKVISEEKIVCSELANSKSTHTIHAESNSEFSIDRNIHPSVQETGVTSQCPEAERHIHSSMQENGMTVQCPEAEQMNNTPAAQCPELEEAQKMLAEDVASWCQREILRSLSSTAAGPSCAHEVSHEEVGRVIIRACLTCKDCERVDTALNENTLRLHLRETEEGAARRFLEEANELKPCLVGRYLGPLTGWLRDGVKKAPHFPEGGHKMWGDLEEMVKAVGLTDR